MFYQVKVPERDMDLLRFLWWPEGNLNNELEEYKMTVHLFGATSSPSCASYALKKTAEDARDIAPEEAVNTVLNNFYVDDCLKSVATEEQAIKLAKDLQTLCLKGGFHLTKWISNSRAVLLSISEEDRAINQKDVDLSYDLLPVERALGVQWCTQTDSFKFQVNLQNKPATRRGILSVVSSIYDLLGFLAPAILPAKFILRELCKEKYAWDQEVEIKYVRQWKKWMDDLQLLADYNVDRCIKPPEFGQTMTAQIHHFGDASENGYGTVSYLLLTNKENKRHCSFLMGKSRVAPLKPVTIPRLELTAAVVAVKMDKMFKQELKIPLKESIFWTDSTTVLRYIANENARYKTFVANRIAVIREHTQPSQWRYVASAQNPADQASRGLTIENFVKNKTWIQGPNFLIKPEHEWPKRPDEMDLSTCDDPEIKRCVANCVIVEEKIEPVKRLVEHYSKWFNLKKAVAWFLRLKEMLMRLKEERKAIQYTVSKSGHSPEKQKTLIEKHMKEYKSSMRLNPLSVDDLSKAEDELIRFSQLKAYPEELKALYKNQLIKKSSKIIKLDPVLQEGILRVGVCMYSAKCPKRQVHPDVTAKRPSSAFIFGS
ncbi:uncharacterized protein LOC114652826 [Erpetoichthys calabaricus]|uniref:uncharacterized protein LOC114652826 n=1 Tax=Erpetoichthys calabaricus TaxID=27687 RepID=UPI0022344A43|nr:uncharacterized protein LOC114652826 [Erpetoichthys calabaricus]